MDDSPCPVGVSELHRPLLNPVPDGVADGSLSVEQLGSRIVGLAGRLAAATCRWLLLVADFDARDGAARFGLPSTAHWLGHYCSLSARTARDHVRVARTLAAHPPLAQAMGAGRVSYSHARAISRVAELGDPTLVQNLVMVAEHGTVGQLEDLVRGLRSVDDNARGPAGPDPEKVTHRWRPDSRWGLSAALDPEHGALIRTALDTIRRRENLTRAQALTRMAEIALASLATDQPAPSLRGDEHAAVVVHLTADAVPAPPELGGSAEPPAPPTRPYARIAGGPGLSRAVADRLTCSGRVRTIVLERDHHPLDVGRNHRLVTDKQYRALLARHHGHCAHPGCTNTIGLEAHHVRHWIHGGKTIMANLVLLCRRHHHTHHDGEFTIVALGGGRFRFLRADGRPLPDHVDPATLTSTDRRIEHDHPHVHPTAATTRWDGTRLDHDYAVAVLAQHLDSTNQRAGYDPWAA